MSRVLIQPNEMCVYKHKYNQSKIQLKLRKIRFACKIWKKKNETRNETKSEERSRPTQKPRVVEVKT